MASMKTDDLVKLVSYGGGVDFNAADRTTDDLVRIASYSKKDSIARIIMRGLEGRSIDELVKIASYGGGTIVFVLN